MLKAPPADTVFIGETEAPTGDPERDGMILRRLGAGHRLTGLFVRQIGLDSLP